MTRLDQIIHEVRAGTGPALPSVCSAHPDVLDAALLLAEELDRPLLIEATSNQVNQFGGYTGMRPAEFIADVRGRADALAVHGGRIIFGGDHLGPQAWKDRPADAAMAEATAMISEYVRAGFTKIHLDCSEGCAGEPEAVGDEIAAGRAADLALVAEEAAPDPDALAYVVGTEVPPPGGARHDDEGVSATPPDRAAATLAAHETAFRTRGLDRAWGRVRALVVQPGLEFSPAQVMHFDTGRPDDLSGVLAPHQEICFEAHSTDYQRAEVFPDLARRNFGILKVGPALTFAWREALYALSHCAGWLDGSRHVSGRMEEIMVRSPKYWSGHYRGNEDEQRLLRHFGLADRIRYYWTDPAAQEAVRDLLARMDATSVPDALLRQYIPEGTLVRARSLGLPPAKSILIAHVQQALLPYFGEKPA